jgi:L-lysine 6-transaminase
VERFASVTRDFKHYFFIDGGALAVENALKAAFDWKAQRLGYTVGMSPSLNQSLADTLDVVHFTNAFHGRSGYTMSLTNTDPLKTRWFPKFNWTRASNPADIEHKMHKDVAAIIIEPVQGEGGDIHFNRATFKHLRKMAYKYDSMLIFDEVQTGLGLTGKMWGYKHYSGVIPDMICFGKKTQVCGFCCTDRINNVPNNVFNVSSRVNSTWGGNIVDMVRFCHIIDAIENDNLVQNAKTIGEYLLGKLMATDGISNVRGKGLMIAFDSPNESTRDRMMELLSENMIALKCGNKSIRLRPHLTFSKEDADTAHSYIEKAAEKL